MTQQILTIRPRQRALLFKLQEFYRYRELITFLVWRSLKVRYAQAVLGVGWSLLQPLLTAAIIALLLGRLARLPTDNVPPYLFYLCALVPWTFFSNALTAASNSLVQNQQLILKIYFPRLGLPVASIVSALVDLAMPLLLLLILVLASPAVQPSPAAIFVLPLLILITIMTAAGMGTILAALHLQYRDVGHILPFLVQMLMLASPVLYSARRLPEQFAPYYALNPLVGVLDGFRSVLLQTHAIPWPAIVSGFFVSLLLLCAGLLFFERVEHRFADVA